MLTCLPLSICSWDFRIQGTSAPAELLFNHFTEQGSVHFGHTNFKVVKHGVWSGHWTFENGSVVAEANKPSAMFRAYELRGDGMTLLLQPPSAFGRTFEILLNGQRVGTIWPAHAFTRRAFIECSPAIPEHFQLFAFWLVALSWRRRQRNNNSGS